MISLGDKIKYSGHIWTAYDKQVCADHVQCNNIFFRTELSVSKGDQNTQFKSLQIGICDYIIYFNRDYIEIISKKIRLK